MPELALPWTEIRYGLASGLAFNPAVSVCCVLVAGVLAGTRRADKWRVAAAYAVVLVGWAVADGIAAAGAFAQVPDVWTAWYPIAWGLVGMLAGYVLPVTIGRFVGIRVTHGTGWLTTMAIGIAAALAFAGLGASDVLVAGLV